MDSPHVIVSPECIVVYDRYPWEPVDDITSWFVAESIWLYPLPEKNDARKSSAA